ncbi:hypothetical protein SDRG_15780 [Saprolegnia diclina VS20]|uniref:Uncharacterized protein n=1 Tax=Saprolegnia diclina (strain VS20) TaxID=1156394 RepID=T0PLV3_SAPDV|nr:hypothetical protein SDRG_15780 [Saprolegnia diclina VS20]EQC26369.1 hypothetical protein SDRG_15780 [Saprolegnia diclina VS20]|eukprot:XP_008620184.1 hypothetical protein SDRG_15780 [Saprolegnia diclina VS20]
MPATGYVVPDLDDGRPVRRKGSNNAHDLVDESTPLSALRRKPHRGLWSPAHRSKLVGVFMLLWLVGVLVYQHYYDTSPREMLNEDDGPTALPMPVLRPPLAAKPLVAWTLGAVLDAYALSSTASVNELQQLLLRIQDDTAPTPRGKWTRSEAETIQLLVVQRIDALTAEQSGVEFADPEATSMVDEEAPMAIDLPSKPLVVDEPTPSDEPAPTPKEATDAPTTVMQPTTEAPTGPTEPATAAPTLRPTEAHIPIETLAATTQPPTPTTLVATTEATTVVTSTSAPPPQPSLRRSTLGYQSDLVLWVKADDGVHVPDTSACAADASQCRVYAWRNQAPGGDAFAFIPMSTTPTSMLPILVPNAIGDLPALYFTCPLVLSPPRTLLRDKSTLFIVLSPATLSESHQTFFGHTPYGQFRLQHQRASFYGAGEGVEAEDNQGIAPGTFSLLVYALDSTMRIKVNGLPFGSETQDLPVHLSPLDTTVLGSAKRTCDDSAFHGRIAEVLLYSSVLSAPNMNMVEDYLLSKWAIPRATQHHAVNKAPLKNDDDDNTIIQDEGDRAVQPAVPATPVQRNALRSGVALVGGYNRDDVFVWVPPAEDPRLAAEWRGIVAAKIKLVERFEFGGKILHEYIDELKEELHGVRSVMFP